VDQDRAHLIYLKGEGRFEPDNLSEGRRIHCGKIEGKEDRKGGSLEH